MLDIKIIMVMTLRDFEVEARYEEWDRMLGREKPGEILGGRRGMFGECIVLWCEFADGRCRRSSLSAT